MSPQAGASRFERAREAGQALVELAIALPILLAILIGVWEFARLWSVQQVITNAAREGARVAVKTQNYPPATVQEAIEAELESANLAPARTTVYLGIRVIPGLPDTVRVSYDYQYQLIGGVVRLISAGAWTGTVRLSSEAVMLNQ